MDSSPPDAARGRRELVRLVVAAVLLQMLIGTVATLRGVVVAWGSLVQRPLLLVALCVIALFARRVGLGLLTAWFAYLAVMYTYGGFVAGYGTLRVLRWIAAVFFAWGTVRLTTSAHLRAYRHGKRPRDADPASTSSADERTMR